MTDLPDIREISFSFSYWVIIIPFAASFCFQFDGIFVGASQTTELRNAMIVSVAIYIVVSFFLIASSLGILDAYGYLFAFSLLQEHSLCLSICREFISV